MKQRCFKTQCPRNGRSFYLKRIFHEIEWFRARGQMDIVREWVHDLRRILPIPEHSFFSLI